MDQSFPSTSVNQYILHNKDYNIIPVKIRLEQASDPSTIHLGPGQQIVFDIKYSGAKAKFYYTNTEVQQIDINDGSSADDLNTPNADHNQYNTLRYKSGNTAPGNETDVINFDARTYATSFGDIDGVAGGPQATFKQTMEGSAIKASITK